MYVEECSLGTLLFHVDGNEFQRDVYEEQDNENLLDFIQNPTQTEECILSIREVSAQSSNKQTLKQLITNMYAITVETSFTSLNPIGCAIGCPIGIPPVSQLEFSDACPTTGTTLHFLTISSDGIFASFIFARIVCLIYSG